MWSKLQGFGKDVSPSSVSAQMFEERFRFRKSITRMHLIPHCCFREVKRQTWKRGEKRMKLKAELNCCSFSFCQNFSTLWLHPNLTLCTSEFSKFIVFKLLMLLKAVDVPKFLLEVMYPRGMLFFFFLTCCMPCHLVCGQTPSVPVVPLLINRNCS